MTKLGPWSLRRRKPNTPHEDAWLLWARRLGLGYFDKKCHSLLYRLNVRRPSNYLEVHQLAKRKRPRYVLMRPSILTLVGRLIGDFTCYNHAPVQQVVNDSPAYSHWLVLGPFQIGTRGGFASSEYDAVDVLIQRRGTMGCRSSGKVRRLSGPVA